ncbi:MAG: peptidylprolyl isomerase [Reyranella sp.]|uniref:peptidylprolyl isomerase n=1 Tax=Reyranella sp. TaxID=1929291 RepID=UPI001AD2F524|nr:peptidylprolyl isomerase [Reyranella sp.]MBN9091624.1 peptidylprolyl isomerase [Reyranella sp.]
MISPRSWFLIVLVAGLGLAIGAASQSADGVVARVNGKPISETDMRLAEVEIMTQLVGLPAERRRQAILDYLIDSQLFADAAERAKLDREPRFEARRHYHLRRALRDAYFDERLRDTLGPEEVRRAYEEQIAALKPLTEYRLRQILLGSEAEARDVRLKLVSGSDFAAVARQASRDPGSAQAGGDLGYLVPAQLDPDLAKAVAALPVGQTSAPVKTRFGWHLVRVEDRRTRPPPTWDEARELVRLELLSQRTREAVSGLRGDASIVYTNPEDAIGK